MWTTDEQVRTRRWKWLGDVLRMSLDKNPNIALTRAPNGKCRRGQPREMWQRTINKEECLGWGEAEVAARDRAAWRRTNGPILHGEGRDRWWWWRSQNKERRVGRGREGSVTFPHLPAFSSIICTFPLLCGPFYTIYSVSVNTGYCRALNCATTVEPRQLKLQLTVTKTPHLNMNSIQFPLVLTLHCSFSVIYYWLIWTQLTQAPRNSN